MHREKWQYLQRVGMGQEIVKVEVIGTLQAPVDWSTMWNRSDCAVPVDVVVEDSSSRLNLITCCNSWSWLSPRTPVVLEELDYKSCERGKLCFTGREYRVVSGLFYI